ncbi:TPA: glycoside hydrolase family 29, partial [Candidatus Latescibacteria bacterium]|nr:glycoside hydrolase family 29 [Candidatus Latescibacterota bacterium]
GKGYHLDADQVWNVLRTARERNCNLLLNSGPLPDGSQDPEDIPVLEEVGRRIREQGFPE